MNRQDYINTLITENIYLASRIAKSKKRKFYNIDLEELESAAYLGLVQAANFFDAQKNNCFAKYATVRIFGAIQDYLRELVWGGRTKEKLIMQEGFDLNLYADKSKTQQNDDDFEKIIENLPIKSKSVLRKYYIKDESIYVIAEDIGVHESRISQILSESRKKLKLIWSERKN